jgi:creatinine amidohydrolase/Fe(II)-dependent formamide hydrolase-like protein
MFLSTATWQEVDARLQGGKRGIIVPIGSHEQHGPTGLIGTDALCPDIIARHAEAQSDILIAPPFSIGMAQHHMGFAGSMTLRPSTMIATIVDWTSSFVRAGFTHIYWINGHGGNVATIQAAFAETFAPYSLRGEQAPFMHALKNWWQLPNIENLCRDLFPVGHGSHGTASEIAVTYWAYPERSSLGRMTLEPKIAPDGPIRDAGDYRKRFPDGRIGSDPTQSTGEQGGILVEASAKALIADSTQFFSEAFL